MATIESARAQAIDAYVTHNPLCRINEQWPMEFGGNIRYEAVFEIPIQLLRYNLNNGRYAMELAREQADAGYTFDPDKPEDHKLLRELLLKLNPEQTELLRRDIEERGQIYPGVITRDGRVINANRRMAILESLHAEHPGGQYEKLRVQRLPDDVDERDLWRLEAGLQLSRDTRADYSPINELLKLRQGRDAGLSPHELSAAMFGRKVSWVEDALDRLAVMEQYLDYFHWSGQYHLLDETNEQFIELQKNMKALEKEGFDAQQLYRWLLAMFEFIRARVSNWDLRIVKKIALDDEASLTVEEQVITKTEAGEHLDPDDVRQTYEAAKATIESKDEKNQPNLLLHKALAALNALSVGTPHLISGANKYTFRKLRKKVEELDEVFKA